MARGVALAAAIAVSLLAVSGAGGAPAQTPKRGGTVVVPGRFRNGRAGLPEPVRGAAGPACFRPTFAKCFPVRSRSAPTSTSGPTS